eukprot:4798193-Karenia_brevis.AAC.1
MQQHNDQFGQRVHLDPKSSAGQALMHRSDDGWMSSCTSGVGWGVLMSGQRIGRPLYMEYAEDGN